MAVVVSFWRELASSVRVYSCTDLVLVCWRLDDRSRMTREHHVRFFERRRVQFPQGSPAARLLTTPAVKLSSDIRERWIGAS